MATLTIELPDELITELNKQQISNKLIDNLVEQTLRVWLRRVPETTLKAEQNPTAPFATSATTYAETLIDENRELFERLAQL